MTHPNQINTDELLDAISQIGKIDGATLRSISDEISVAAIPYKTAYTDFQSGGWHTAMLYSPNGTAADSEIKDGRASPTELMDSLPITRTFLEGLGLDFFAVRVAKTDPDAYLWEHRDYVELGSDKKLRLHIPLVTNEHALMQFGDCAVHMARGFIWKLDPNINHAISNTGNTPRTHLILDAYVTPALESMVAHEVLLDRFVTPLTILDPASKQSLLGNAKTLLNNSGVVTAEILLLKAFHKYDLGTATSYDLLADFYAGIGFKERELYWIKEGVSRMAVREKINPADKRVSMRGTLFQAAYETPDLIQYKLLNDILETCRSINGLDSAYVRGSLARGDADPLSDIDLLCVVSPDQYANFIERANQLIQSSYDPIGEPWADPIVRDFGGMGFIYLIQEDGHPYQLDLYIAARGSPGLENLGKLPVKQQIYRSKPDKALFQYNRDTLAEAQYKLNADEVTRTIKQKQNPPATPEAVFSELCILSFMIQKGLKRGESFVAGDEFNMWKKGLIKLLRMKFDPDLVEYGFYHVKRFKDLIPDDGALYRELIALNNMKLSPQRFAQVFTRAFDLYQTHFPDASERSINMGAVLREYFADVGKPTPKTWLAKNATRPVRGRGNVAIKTTGTAP